MYNYKNEFLLFSTDISNSRRQNFSPQSFEMSSKPGVLFTLEFFYHLLVVFCLITMVTHRKVYDVLLCR